MVAKIIEATPMTAVERLRFPRQGEWTYEDWLNFPNDGWKYEIIDGVLHMAPPPAINHQRSSGELFRRIANYVKDNDLGEVLEAPCGVQLPNQPVPVEPDIFFVKKERLDIIGDQYVEGPPDLVVEILSPCPTGWDYDPKETVNIGQLAVKTGIWPLKEYVDGQIVHTKIPRERIAVEEYLKLQGRYKHLFEPERNGKLISEIQDKVDRYWNSVGK